MLVSRLLIGVGQERGDPGVGRQGYTPAGWVGGPARLWVHLAEGTLMGALLSPHPQQGTG